MRSKFAVVWTSLIAATALCCFSAAYGIALQEGVNFKRVPTPQPVETGSKIEVIEFFSYACPHCDHFEPILEPWVKKLPADVQFRRVPALFQQGWVDYAKIYYTLLAMGKAEELSGDVFHAIHDQGVVLGQDTVFFDWAAKHGLDRQKVIDTFNSFTVASQLKRALSQAQSYHIEGVPAMVIDGKYFVDGGTAGSYEAWMSIADELIVKARQERSAKPQ